MKSIFEHKEYMPDEKALRKALGSTFSYWQQLVAFTNEIQADTHNEWYFLSAKYGWNYRIKDKKRAIIYLLPRDGFFKVSFVFGQKATGEIMTSDIAEVLKARLLDAKPYAEGRGLTFDIKDAILLDDVKQLIQIKAAG